MCVFYKQKDSVHRIFIKKCVLFIMGCLSYTRKSVYSWVSNVANDEEVETEV
jgi:uncharacterized protein involved in tolerance to divalent cations